MDVVCAAAKVAAALAWVFAPIAGGPGYGSFNGPGNGSGSGTTPVPFPPDTVYCPTDLDANGVTDARDVSCFLNLWFQDRATGRTDADWTRDGVVDAKDISVFLQSWTAERRDGCDH